ncbi:MAG: hypothetical protein ACKV1O_01125 [Saprospiraceae bacterium]
MNYAISVPFEIIERFAAKHSIPLEKSISVHADMIAYLDKQDNSSPNQLVDEVWHHFILHTRDYQHFCRERYGKFIHHAPHGMKADYLNQKVRILLEQTNVVLVNAGDQNDVAECGVGACNQDGTGGDH